MTQTEIEERVRRVAQSVKEGRNPEDNMVEVKYTWPSSNLKSARQLGGALNSMYPEDVVWVVGLHSTAGAMSSEPTELKHWWTDIEKCFNELPPGSPVTFRVPWEGEELTVLWFKANRAPYVIEWIDANGKWQREVPWRTIDGAKEGGATRGQLVDILVPKSKIPTLEITSARVGPLGTLEVSLFIAPKTSDLVAFATHRMRFELTVGEAEFVHERIESLNFTEIAHRSRRLER